MKANRFLERLLNKWYIKVICLIIAFFLYIFHQSSLIEKKSFVIPLEVIEDGSVIHTSDIPSNVTVIVRCGAEQISTIHSDLLLAQVNINNISRDGEYTLPISVKVSDELLTYDPFEIRVKPENIKLQVEKKDLQFADIIPSVAGEPMHGYEYKGVTIDPKVVEITGPKSIVSSISYIYTEKIDITDFAQDTELFVNYRPLNNIITLDNEGPYKVNISIVPKQMERTFENVSIYPKSLDDKLYIKNQLDNIAFKLTGTMPFLENYNLPDKFVSVDLKKIVIPGNYDLPLQYNLPANVTINEDAPKTVFIEIMSVEEEIINPESGLGIIE